MRIRHGGTLSKFPLTGKVSERREFPKRSNLNENLVIQKSGGFPAKQAGVLFSKQNERKRVRSAKMNSLFGRYSTKGFSLTTKVSWKSEFSKNERLE